MNILEYTTKNVRKGKKKKVLNFFYIYICYKELQNKQVLLFKSVSIA